MDHSHIPLISMPKPIRLTVRKPTDHESFMASMWSGPNALPPAPAYVSPILTPYYVRRVHAQGIRDDVIRTDLHDAVAGIAAMHGFVIAAVIDSPKPVRPTRWDLVV